MDLSTTFLGLKLKNPLVPSASPLMRKVDNIKRMEDAGAAAIVLHSLFEEEIRHADHELDHYLSYGAETLQKQPGSFQTWSSTTEVQKDTWITCAASRRR